MFVVEAAVKELKIDKDNLVRENAELREKNLNFALITSDLNSKVKELEHERDSLVTAMKLQQQEFEQGHYEREDGEKWKTVSAIKQSKEDQAAMNFESNRYDVLSDEANTQNSDLHASVIEINSETQQPSTGQNTAVDNDNISPENGDNVSNCTQSKVIKATVAEQQSKPLSKCGYQCKVLLLLVIQLLKTLIQ